MYLLYFTKYGIMSDDLTLNCVAGFTFGNLIYGIDYWKGLSNRFYWYSRRTDGMETGHCVVDRK